MFVKIKYIYFILIQAPSQQDLLKSIEFKANTQTYILCDLPFQQQHSVANYSETFIFYAVEEMNQFTVENVSRLINVKVKQKFIFKLKLSYKFFVEALIFQIKSGDSSMNAELQLVQGLSKRERSKIERLMKNDESIKAQNHSKSYKRKNGKGKHLEESGHRLLINNEAHGNSEQSQPAFSPYGESMKNENPNQTGGRKKVLKQFKPFNPNFPVQGGEQGLFSYIMLYSYSEKEKKIDAPVIDLSFLDSFAGQPLELVDNSAVNKKKDKADEQFLKIKQKIETPFDQVHRQFTKRISSKQFQQK